MFDYDTAALTAVAVAMRDKGELPTGKKVGGKAEFFIAAADVPIDPPAGWEPKSLKAQDRGRLRVRADPVLHGCRRGAALHGAARRAWRAAAVPDRDFAAALGQVGALDAEKLFGTIIPDATIARLEAAADPAAEGRKLCVDLMRELATIPGVAGVHIMAPGNEAAIADVIRDAAGSSGRSSTARVPNAMHMRAGSCP